MQQLLIEVKAGNEDINQKKKIRRGEYSYPTKLEQMAIIAQTSGEEGKKKKNIYDEYLEDQQPFEKATTKINSLLRRQQCIYI